MGYVASMQNLNQGGVLPPGQYNAAMGQLAAGAPETPGSAGRGIFQSPFQQESAMQGQGLAGQQALGAQAQAGQMAQGAQGYAAQQGLANQNNAAQAGMNAANNAASGQNALTASLPGLTSANNAVNARLFGEKAFNQLMGGGLSALLNSSSTGGGGAGGPSFGGMALPPSTVYSPQLQQQLINQGLALNNQSGGTNSRNIAAMGASRGLAPESGLLAELQGQNQASTMGQNANLVTNYEGMFQPANTAQATAAANAGIQQNLGLQGLQEQQYGTNIGAQTAQRGQNIGLLGSILGGLGV